MSWLIKQYKNGKYGIYTTISDGYITEPRQLTKEQAIDYISKYGSVNCQDNLENFPKGWFDKDTYKMIC